MSIRDRQLSNETLRILMDGLRDGGYPDLTVVQERVSKKFASRQAGLPLFQLIRVGKKEISSASHYNDMVENLHEDLSVAFQEVRYQGDRMMALADYYETEKFRINQQIRKLNRRMEILNEKLEDRGLRTVIFDTFNDYVRLEFDGNSKRSLQSTDAFVDLRNGYATLNTIKSGQDKVNLSHVQANVKAITEFDDFQQLSRIEGALVDTINEAWRHEGVLSTPKEAEILLTLVLPAPITMNLISFTPQSPRPSVITLLTSSDGENYKEQLPRTIKSYTEWNIEKENIKSIQFRIKKMEPDIANGAQYHYLFGAQNISVRQVTFVGEGNVVSTPLEVNRVVDKITLKVDDVVLPGTNIKYFVTEDKMDGSVLDWETIEPNQTILSHGLITDSVYIDEKVAQYGNFYKTLYSQDYYAISKLAHAPVERTPVMFMGEGMWQVDSMDYTADASFKPTLDNWKQASHYNTSFVSLDKASGTEGMVVGLNKLERMTLYITMANDYILLANPITSSAGMNLSVYLNNTEIKGINGDYTYNLKKGLNKIEVLYYATVAGEIAPNLSYLYLESIGATDMYATNLPLKQVDIYDLMNNTSKKDFGKFAIDINNQVIVNYNPKALDKSGKGLRYKLSYRYPKDSTKTNTFLRFMAKLSHTGKGDVSPILRSYKLIVE